MNKFKYYEIGNRKFSLEHISDDFYELVIFEENHFIGTYCFEGSTAYADALAEILSYSEIDEDDYNA